MATSVGHIFGKYFGNAASGLSFAPLLYSLISSKDKKEAVFEVSMFLRKNGVAVEEKRVVRTSTNIIEGNGRNGF